MNPLELHKNASPKKSEAAQAAEVLGGVNKKIAKKQRTAPQLNYHDSSKEYCNSPERIAWCRQHKCDHPSFPSCWKCPHTDVGGRCAHPQMANELIRAGKASPWKGTPEDQAWIVGKRGGPKEMFFIIPAKIVEVEDDD